MRPPIDCLVLAGGTPVESEPLYAQTRGAPKALLEIGGKPMVQWVLDALAETDRIDRVIVVGLGQADLVYPGGLTVLPGGGSWSDNFFVGVESLGATAGQLAAFCWSDIPLLSGPMVERFLDRVGEHPALVHAGLVEKGLLEARFGPLAEPYLRLREGRFVAADFGVFQPHEAPRLRAQLEELAPQRKSAWKQARTVGWGLLARYLLGRLSIAHLQERVSTGFEISCRIHTVEDPEMGLDVDGPANLAICRRELASRATSRVDSGVHPAVL